MSYELKDMAFTLFRETTKRENGPDWTGTVKIDGREMRIAAWEKQGRNGTFLSGKITPFMAKRDAPGGTTKARPARDDEMDAPF